MLGVAASVFLYLPPAWFGLPSHIESLIVLLDARPQDIPTAPYFERKPCVPQVIQITKASKIP